ATLARRVTCQRRLALAAAPACEKILTTIAGRDPVTFASANVGLPEVVDSSIRATFLGAAAQRNATRLLLAKHFLKLLLSLVSRKHGLHLPLVLVLHELVVTPALGRHRVQLRHVHYAKKRVGELCLRGFDSCPLCSRRLNRVLQQFRASATHVNDAL